MISKNLVGTDTHRGSDQHTTIRSGSCPNCGEAAPHLTEEDIERRKEQQKINKTIREALHEQTEKQARKEKMLHFYLIYPIWALFIIFSIWMVVAVVLFFRE